MTTYDIQTTSVVEIPTTVNVMDAAVSSVDVVEVGVVGPQGAVGPQGSQGATGATGAKGDTGSSGVVNVTAPITNSGTSTSAQLGLDQTALSIQPTQVVGTAVITTDTRLSNARTPTAHASTHGVSGSDSVTIASSQISDKGAANGVATLDGSGLVPTTQIPPLAINDTFVVASQTAMLALTAQVGDVAVRTDVNKTFILQTEPASTLANWIQVLTPPAVTSITASSPLTGGTITSTGTIGIDQTALAITSDQVSGLATSATTDTTNASNITSGTLAVGRGGTGQTTLTSGNALIGAGTSGVTTTAVSTTGGADSIVKSGTAGVITAGSGGVTSSGQIAVSTSSNSSPAIVASPKGSIAITTLNSTSISSTAASVTLTANVSSSASFGTGQTVTITGSTNTTYNGTYKIVSVPVSGVLALDSLSHGVTPSGAFTGTATVTAITAANQQEWQDTAGSTVLANVDGAGNIVGKSLTGTQLKLTGATSGTTQIIPSAVAPTYALLPSTSGTLATIETVNSNVLGALGMSSTQIETMPRIGNPTFTSLTAGSAFVTYFTPLINFTVTNISLMVSTQASGVATYQGIGLYSADSSNALTLLNSTTASSLTYWTSANSWNSVGITSTTLTAGQRYAIAILQVGGTPPTAATATGTTIAVSAFYSTGNNALSKAVTSSTAIPATGVTPTSNTTPIFFRLT